MPRSIKQLSTRLVYENRWISLREDKVQFPGGHEGIYTVVDKADFATIIPVHDDGRIQLVELYRYPVGRLCWELPQGSWEDNPDADPADVARGELAEETGLIAEDIIKLGEMFNSYGLVSQTCHIFLARGLTQGQTAREVTEEGMETASFTLTEVKDMTQNGAFPDAISIGALGYWQMMTQTP